MSDTYSRSKLSTLKLVFPAMSNQEAHWFKDDPAVATQLKTSDFYMIGARAEAKFSEIEMDQQAAVARFNFLVHGHAPEPVEIHFHELPGCVEKTPDELCLEASEKHINIWSGPPRAPGSELMDQFTTERLLLARSHNRSGIRGLNRYLEFLTYDLLYVGIAKEGDSFERLINHGHEKRMEILSNEPQRSPGARVADEIYLFLMQVDPLIMTTFEWDHDFEESDFTNIPDMKRIVADAEKAFVSLLRPEYNVTRFNRYPEGTDGLFDSDLSRYGYVIAEDLEFTTAHGRFRGRRDPHGFISNDADFIFINGDEVSLFVSGVDFPGETGAKP
jgi:hypothetical protein